VVRGLMSDEEWAFFAPFLVRAGAGSGRPPANHRLILDGYSGSRAPACLSVTCNLHEHFGKWSSVYRQFRRWTLAGTWDVILQALNDSGLGQDSVQMIDSTVVRAHQHAAGAKKKVPLQKQALRARVLAVLVVATRPRST
jgi:transposase